MSLRKRASGRVLLVLAIFVIGLMSSAVLAQEATVPKVDIFAGYSWYDAGMRVNGMKLDSNPIGFGAAITYNANKWLGLTLDGAGHLGSDNNQAGTVMIGPRLTFRDQEHFRPFIHALGGLHLLTLDSQVPGGSYNHKGIGLKLGGGFDIPINNRFSYRLFEANYLWSHHNLYPQTAVHGNTGRGAELRTGIVFNFGGAPPLPPMAMSCSAAQPASVLAGEPVSVSANVTNIPPKKTLTYEWSSTGGKVSGSGTGAQIDTAGLAPGTYTVTAKAIDPKPKKNQGPLSCTSTFTVNEPPKHPPTAQCSANPTTVRAGDTSTVNVTAGNPDNRPLTYNYTATAGRVTGNNATATLDTAGASAGPIQVTATVSDDRGLSANCTASVNVEVPPPPPQATKINECQFPDKRRPSRVDNACKAVLDEVALRLQREADARLVIVGHGDPADKKNMARFSAERAINSRTYLTTGEAKQGIDPTRIELRTGADTGMTAEYWLVPAGANFTMEGTQPVDEAKFAPKKPAKRR
ncbi:MAG TPA: outer membrane beta-barrel protein [Terriglobales bacterium]|nr:outer membrane beta-barrel protein [Terriglobales bacterium]